MEKKPCVYPDCKSRLSRPYKDGRDLCRTHTVEIMEIDNWIDDWLAKNYTKK